MDTRARTCASAATGTAARCGGQNGEQAEGYEDCYELFHGMCFSSYLYADRSCCFHLKDAMS